jgi:drug/metabolite transporter (DMT)-like permease
MCVKAVNRHVRGALLITAAMFIFSCIGPFVRAIGLSPAVIILFSSGLAALLLLGWFAYRGALGSVYIRGQSAWLFVSALSLFGNVFCFYHSYRLTTMANAVITHYTAPVFAALLAPLLIGEKRERVTGIALIISTTGLVLIAGNIAPGSAHLAGTALGLLSGLFYGISIVVGKRLVGCVRPSVIMLYQSSILVCLALPFALFETWQPAAGSFLLLGGYALVVCLLAPALYLRGLRHVAAQHAGILAYSELLFVVLLGVMLGEQPGANVLAGGLLIAISGWIILRAESRRP